MVHDVLNDGFLEIIDPDTAPEQIGGGFDFTEGPVWHPRDKTVIFSDMPGNHMRVWTEAGGVRTFRRPSDMANGNAYDLEGRLVTCEHATSRVTRTGHDGRIEVLASHYDGKELNSPNDIIVASDGAIVFTDPGFGRMPYYGVERDPELDFRGVYRLEAGGGEVRLLASDFDQPNGLCLSLDETRLWINDTMRGHIRVFDVGADGSLSSGRVWAEVAGEGPGAPDGMKIDAEERIYCTGPGPGIHVFGRDAAPLGVIRIPEGVANFCFGGADMRTLFVTASTSLYRVALRAVGPELRF